MSWTLLSCRMTSLPVLLGDFLVFYVLAIMSPALSILRRETPQDLPPIAISFHTLYWEETLAGAHSPHTHHRSCWFGFVVLFVCLISVFVQDLTLVAIITFKNL